MLGLAIKASAKCAPYNSSPCLRIRLPRRAMLDRDEAWPPESAHHTLPPARITPAEARLLEGRLMVHLPMQVLQQAREFYCHAYSYPIVTRILFCWPIPLILFYSLIAYALY